MLAWMNNKFSNQLNGTTNPLNQALTKMIQLFTTHQRLNHTV